MLWKIGRLKRERDSNEGEKGEKGLSGDILRSGGSREKTRRIDPGELTKEKKKTEKVVRARRGKGE